VQTCRDLVVVQHRSAVRASGSGDRSLRRPGARADPPRPVNGPRTPAQGRSIPGAKEAADGADSTTRPWPAGVPRHDAGSDRWPLWSQQGDGSPALQAGWTKSAWHFWFTGRRCRQAARFHHI